MLDFAHGMVLRGVAEDPRGDHGSPALDDLLACGLVARDDERGLLITGTGQEVLRRSARSHREVWATRVVAVCLVCLAISTIVDWAT